MSKNIEPGTTIPDFELPDENGEMHSLSEIQGDNLLVLHLSRGEHCPRERMHHREMLRFYEWCSLAFTELVTLMPNTQHDVLRLKIGTGAHWTFLADEDLEAQRHFDIRTPIHYSAQQAGDLAREAKARRLMLTHLWPTLDPVASVEEGSEAFGHAVSLAAPHLVTHI